MKISSLILIGALCLACQEENNTPDNTIEESFDPTQATLIKTGTLVGSGHTVTGTATIYESDGNLIVLLDPFASQNGPDLKVYLSKDASASEFVSLGALKSVNGKQAYEVQGVTDVAPYNFVLIWCRQFSVLFGKAELS